MVQIFTICFLAMCLISISAVSTDGDEDTLRFYQPLSDLMELCSNLETRIPNCDQDSPNRRELSEGMKQFLRLGGIEDKSRCSTFMQSIARYYRRMCDGLVEFLSDMAGQMSHDLSYEESASVAYGGVTDNSETTTQGNDQQMEMKRQNIEDMEDDLKSLADNKESAQRSLVDDLKSLADNMESAQRSLGDDLKSLADNMESAQRSLSDDTYEVNGENSLSEDFMKRNPETMSESYGVMVDRAKADRDSYTSDDTMDLKRVLYDLLNSKDEDELEGAGDGAFERRDNDQYRDVYVDT